MEPNVPTDDPCASCPALLDYRHRTRCLVMVASCVVIAITLLFASYRIYTTSAWLQQQKEDARARDAAWLPVLKRIEDHLTAQDDDSRAIRENQAKILSRLSP